MQQSVHEPLFFDELTIVTRKTLSSQKQSSLLEQSSMQQSVHEPLCFVEHTKKAFIQLIRVHLYCLCSGKYAVYMYMRKQSIACCMLFWH